MFQHPEKTIPSSLPDPNARRKLMWIFAAGALITATVFALTWQWQPNLPKRYVPVVAKPIPKLFKAPTTLDELANLTPAELDHCDIALMNLLCTQGLPGAEKVNVAEMLTTLDQWAAHVQAETDRNMHRFYENPKNFNNSEAYFRMIFFVTIMQEDFGVHYNPDLMDPSVPDEIFLADARNVFINGLVGPERMGTCSSMPVLYVAVARRLGYPLYLAEAKGHFFTQWNDGMEHFNIEGTSWGFGDHSDDFYRKWPEPITDEDMKLNRYLRPMTGAEELSAFLQNRGGVLAIILHNYQVALGCFERARELTPAWADVAITTKQLEKIAANPALQGPDVNEIEHMNEVYRRLHGHYTPALPAGVAVDSDPMSNVSRPEQWRPNSIVAQFLPQNIPLPASLTSQAMISGNIPGTVLPNGLSPDSMTTVPNPIQQQTRDAYDSWPNLRPSQQPPWLNPHPLP